jgi:hypothetical protein
MGAQEVATAQFRALRESGLQIARVRREPLAKMAVYA